MSFTKSFPIPVRTIGPGSQSEDDGLDYMVMPRGMDTYRSPVLPEPEDMARHHGTHDVLRAAIHALDRAHQGLPTQPISVMGLSDADLTLLNQVLGEGEVSARVQRDDGEVLVQESVFAGVWRVVHRRDGEAISDQLEVGRMPLAVLEAASTHQPLTGARRVRLTDGQASWPADVMNAPAILNELEDHIANWRPGQPVEVINLTLLPLSPADLAVIDQCLGQGSTVILSRGYGNCRITLSEVPHTWRLSYFNSQDTAILNTIEVTDIPDVACAAREDLEDSLERLQEVLQWVQGG